MNPRHRRYERSNRSLHHRRGVLFVGEQVSTEKRINAAPRANSRARNPRHDGLCEGASTVRDTPASLISPSLCEEVSARFTTDKLYPGERATQALGRWQTKYPASSPPGIQNSPSFPHDKGFGAAGNKNPSGAWLGRGSINRTLNRLQPIPPPRESARAPTSA